MEENPYKSPEGAQSPTSLRAKLLLAACVAVALARTLMLLIGTLRVLVVPERRENLLAVVVYIIWPAIAVAVWTATAAATRQRRWSMAIVGLALGICDFMALALVRSPIEM